MKLTKKQIKGIRCAKDWQLSDYAWSKPQKMMIKTFLEKLKKKIEKAEWIDWSCGRSTDYVNEFWQEGSIDNIKEEIDKLAGKIN